MRVYVGQTRSRALIAELTSLGFGEIVQRHEMVPRRLPYALDNGAFGDWRAERPFDALAFQEAAHHAAYLDYGLGEAPDFIVTPDRVAGGLESLRFSLTFVEWLYDLIPGVPIYLVTQDGMTESDVEPHLAPFGGIFVGGSLAWKVATGEGWVRFAHAHGLNCHIGRVGTARRVAWALRIGADSIDSCLPLWSRGNLDTFCRALEARQGDLFSSLEGAP